MTMGRPGRAVIPLLGAFTAVAIVVAGVAVTLQMQERNQRLARERELVLVKAENDDLQQRLGEMRTAKQQAEETLARTKAQLDESAQQLAQERQEKEGLTKAVDERQKEIDRLSKDVESVRSERASLTEQVTKLKTQQANLQKKLAQAEKARTELEAKAFDTAPTSFDQPTVSLDPVVVKNQPTVEPVASLPVSRPAPLATPTPVVASDPVMSGVKATNASQNQGQVVVVNRDYDFVVMNLGRNHGLEIGQEFQIVHGAEVIGRVKVEKVYDELAAAAILPDSKKDVIREGDVLKAI